MSVYPDSGNTPPANTTTPGGLDPNLINQLINAGLLMYGVNQGTKPPKFYIAPPTPAEQWQLQGKQGLYGVASNYVNQYLQGLSNLNPNWQMPNSLTGNPAFMGGVHIPTFDPSKTFQPISPTPPPPSPPAKVPNGIPIGGQPDAPGTGAPGQLGTGGPAAPVGSPGDPFGSLPFNQPPGGNQINVPDLWGWMQSHPGIMSAGVGAVIAGLTAAFGPAGGLIGKIGTSLYNWYARNKGSGTSPSSGDNPNQYPNPIGPTQPRSDWTANQGPGYQDFWAWMDQNLRSDIGNPGGGGTDFGGRSPDWNTGASFGYNPFDRLT